MGIVRPVMETHPHARLFFITFILIATFTVLNLFIAIIVDAMQAMAKDADFAHGDVEHQCESGQVGSLAEVHRELKEIRHLLEQRGH